MIAMPKLNIQMFIGALKETEQYTELDQSEAIQYIYNTLYKPVIDDVPIRLSDFNFDKFTLEDVSAFEDYYDEELQQNERQSCCLLDTLYAISPIQGKTKFI